MCIRDSCPLAEKETVSFDDLQGLPLIASAQAYSGRQRLELFGEIFDLSLIHI